MICISSIHGFVFDSTRELVLGRYYPVTSEEADILIRKGLGRDLINFVSDRGYSFLYPVVS